MFEGFWGVIFFFLGGGGQDVRSGVRGGSSDFAGVWGLVLRWEVLWFWEVLCVLWFGKG